ncbi:DUF1289 domain-containing protein [Vibrio sonorensis]|uniref:DUF1289 domain-containing protein n=1 Tax=Vibrio sonorensis TaxID=1004316 RepID=UPI000A03491F|nr:DUF1289 domain-containing protein [Vibrio sonorensis]
MKTPCVAACKNDGGICSGCYRTMDEIINWKSFSDEQREQIMNRLDKSESTHECPTCGEPTHCDISQGKETCWCFDIERRDTSKVEKCGSCMCRRCLSQLPLR